jgi:hypothetical protein
MRRECRDRFRGPRQRRRDLDGSLRRRCERGVMDGDGSPRRGGISKRLHGEVGDGGAGARRGLIGWPRRARKRRGALGRRAMGTPVPRGCDRGAPTIGSHGALAHGHARPVSRQAVARAASADLHAGSQHASGNQDQHQGAEQEPQAWPRSQEQPFPHEAQDNSGHVPTDAIPQAWAPAYWRRVHGAVDALPMLVAHDFKLPGQP